MDLMSTAQLLGNFGEFVGAIAVVATLIYLASQIRHNTAAQKTNSVWAMTQIFNQTHTSIVEHADVAEIMDRARDGRLTSGADSRRAFSIVATIDRCWPIAEVWGGERVGQPCALAPTFSDPVNSPSAWVFGRPQYADSGNRRLLPGRKAGGSFTGLRTLAVHNDFLRSFSLRG
jgi:hypothetical protein